MQVGVPTEATPGENRVAATPRTVSQLIKLGYDVVVASGAGARSSLPDAHYVEAGARIVTEGEALGSDVVLLVNAPDEGQLAQLRPQAHLPYLPFL